VPAVVAAVVVDTEKELLVAAVVVVGTASVAAAVGKSGDLDYYVPAASSEAVVAHVDFVEEPSFVADKVVVLVVAVAGGIVAGPNAVEVAVGVELELGLVDLDLGLKGSVHVDLDLFVGFDFDLGDFEDLDRHQHFVAVVADSVVVVAAVVVAPTTVVAEFVVNARHL